MGEANEKLIGLLATVLSSLHHVEAGAARLCEAGRHLLEAEGAALSLTTSDQTTMVVAATDELAGQLEDLQEAVGEGPSKDAVLENRVQIADFTAHGDGRWALMHEHGERLGFHGAMVAVPLTPHERVIGTFSAYRRTDRFEFEPVMAEFLGAALGAALLDDSRSAGQDDGFGEVWALRSQIHQATGMIIAQVGVRGEDALALLRGQAFVQATTMLDVAQQIVERHINFRHFTIEGD